MLIPVDAAAHREAAKSLPLPRLLIGAQQIATGSAGSIRQINPATGETQAEVPMGAAPEIDAAVKAARRGFEAWQALKPVQRRDRLTRLAELIEARIADFARIAPLETGTSRSVFEYGMAPRIINWCKYYAGWADKVEGQVVASAAGENFEYTLPEPYGVIGHIITWNAPLLSLAMKIPPSLAAGNAVVIKPAEFTPYSAMLFAELGREAGLPDGLINVVTGGAEAGEALVKHPGVDKISFTGGPIAARKIMENAALNLTPVLFELGGKSANLIFDDAKLDDVVPYSTMFVMNNAGQGCALPTRLLVQERIYNDVVERVVQAIKTLTVGDPFHPHTLVGPLVNAAARQRVLGMIDEARAQNAGRLLVGGGAVDASVGGGYFVEPTLFTDVDPHSALAQQEVFGPVLAISRFRDEAEAVAIANSTAYGLSAYVQTHDLQRAHRLVRQLRAGTVYVNRGQPTASAAAPFGGIGLSGFGREGGKAGLDEFVRVKGVGISVDGA